MANSPDSTDRRTMSRALSNRQIAVAGFMVLLVTAAAAALLIWLFGHDADKAQLDALRTALSIGAGTGAAAALMLAARRQQSTELALAHTRHDATERRITELYTKAADQLGSDKAPVRLAGLYALERLAQDNLEHRQTIVNVICAYLRMPFVPPPLRPISKSPRLGLRHRRPTSARPREARIVSTKADSQEQEIQVRLTAQRIIADHLRPFQITTINGESEEHSLLPNPTFWDNISLDLTNSTLVDFNLNYCRITKAAFEDTTFIGLAWFDHARFCGDVSFLRSRFTDSALFWDAHFSAAADFWDIQFSEMAAFADAQFDGDTSFINAQFHDEAMFWGTQFLKHASFAGADFNSHTDFRRAKLVGASFESARFSRSVYLIHPSVNLTQARVVNPAVTQQEWPPGWTIQVDDGIGLLVRGDSTDSEHPG